MIFSIFFFSDSPESNVSFCEFFGNPENFSSLSSLEILCASSKENPSFPLNRNEIRTISHFIRKSLENCELSALKISIENPSYNQIDFEYFDEPTKLNLATLKTFKFLYKSKEILIKPQLIQQKLMFLGYLKNLENLKFHVFCKNSQEIEFSQKIVRKNLKKLNFFISSQENPENPLKINENPENPLKINENPMISVEIPLENLENPKKNIGVPIETTMLEEFSGIIEENSEENFCDFLRKNAKIKVLKLFFKDISYGKVLSSVKKLFFLRKFLVSFEENVGFTDENLKEILNILFSPGSEPFKDLFSIEFLIKR